MSLNYAKGTMLFIHVSNIWIYVISCVCLSSQPNEQPAGHLHGKNFVIGHCPQTFQPNYFIPAALMDTHWLLPFHTTFILTHEGGSGELGWKPKVHEILLSGVSMVNGKHDAELQRQGFCTYNFGQLLIGGPFPRTTPCLGWSDRSPLFWKVTH